MTELPKYDFIEEILIKKTTNLRERCFRGCSVNGFKQLYKAGGSWENQHSLANSSGTNEFLEKTDAVSTFLSTAETATATAHTYIENNK